MNQKSHSIVSLTANEILPLRSLVLRPGLALEKSIFNCDSEPTTFHLGIKNQDLVISQATFALNSPPEILKNLKHFDPTDYIAYQLRGMAVHPEYKRQGLGRLVLQAGETLLKNKNCQLLWMNARTSALDFYSSLQYTVIGNEFEIPDVGPHKIMYKWIN